jgi:hypothetical protein
MLDDQAIGRLNRPPQKRHVIVYRFIATDTCDIDLEAIRARKDRLARAFFSGKWEESSEGTEEGAEDTGMGTDDALHQSSEEEDDPAYDARHESQDGISADTLAELEEEGNGINHEVPEGTSDGEPSEPSPKTPPATDSEPSEPAETDSVTWAHNTTLLSDNEEMDIHQEPGGSCDGNAGYIAMNTLHPGTYELQSEFEPGLAGGDMDLTYGVPDMEGSPEDSDLA